MHKINTKTALAVFLPNFQKPAHPYQTIFSKQIYKKQIKIQNICKRSIPLECLQIVKRESKIYRFLKLK